MPRGGRRKGAGRKAANRPPELPEDAKQPDTQAGWARLIDVLNKPPIENESEVDPEAAGFRPMWDSIDVKVRLPVRIFAYRMRDGDPPRVVKYIHDKPLEVNMKVELSEVVREVRERKRNYERSRG